MLNDIYKDRDDTNSIMSKPIPVPKKGSVKPPTTLIDQLEKETFSLPKRFDELSSDSSLELMHKSKSMSFSMIIDKIDNKYDTKYDNSTIISNITGQTPPDNDFVVTHLNKIYPRETNRWIESSLVNNCQTCKIKFSNVVLLGSNRHHCRACGGVFCGNCCYQFITIPTKYIQIPKEDDTYPQLIKNTLRKLLISKESLVCNECFIKISNLNKISHLISVFEFLDIQSLYNVFSVCIRLKDIPKNIITIDDKSNIYSDMDIESIFGFDSIIIDMPKPTTYITEKIIYTHKLVNNGWITTEKKTYTTQGTMTKMLSKFTDEKKMLLTKSMGKINTLESRQNWYNAVIHQLSRFRIIQYAYSDKLYNDWEINILWNTRHLLSGHDNWMLSLTKSIIQQYYKKYDETLLDKLKKIILNTKKTKSCHYLMCSRKCNVSLDILDFIEILKFIGIIEDDIPEKTVRKMVWVNDKTKRDPFKDLIIFVLKKLYTEINTKTHVIRSVIPLLCSVFCNLMKGNYALIDFSFLKSLFDEICYEKNITIHILNEVEYLDGLVMKSDGIINFVKFMRIYLEGKIDDDIMDKVILMKRVLSTITKYKKNNEIDLPILYPLDFNYNIIEIKKITEIKSNTSPLLLEVVITETGSSKYKTVKFFIKKDKVLRKEMIVSCLITVLLHKLGQQADKGRLNNDKFGKYEGIPTYQISMITINMGVIEFVDNSITLRHISTEGKDLEKYITSQLCNRYEQLDTIKKRFLKSAAISSCMSYLLGIYDRHLDNIMVNTKGQIFHIDYGYIMDSPSTHILNVPNIKMTTDMINFMDGKDSEYYKEFIEYLVKIYEIMRLYKNTIINYYEMIGNEKFIDWNIAKEKLETRFMEGLRKQDIDIVLINEIETSISYSSAFVDMCHDVRQRFTGFFTFG